MDTSPRLRLSVEGETELSWDVGPDDLAALEGATAGSAARSVHPLEGARAGIRELPTTPADRAAGARRFELSVEGWTFVVRVEPHVRAQLRDRATVAAAGVAHLAPLRVRAPITGRIVRLWVAEGDTVETGQRLLAIEAMKMENEVRAPRGGIVEAIEVAAGDRVEIADALLTVR